MENTKGYKGGMEIGWNIAVDALSTIVTISDSKLNKLLIGFPDGESAFISDLVLRQPTNFDLNNIHVVNTEIQTQWGVFMTGPPGPGGQRCWARRVGTDLADAHAWSVPRREAPGPEPHGTASEPAR